MNRIFDWFRNLLDKVRSVRHDPFGTRYQTVVIPRLGMANRNGRIYTRDIAERMCGQVGHTMLGQIGMSDSTVTSLSSVSHKIHRIFIVGNDLWAEYSVLDTPEGRLLYDLFQKVGKEEFVLRPSGVGSIRDRHIQDNYEVTGFHFIPASEDAFRPYDLSDVMNCGPDVFGNKQAFERWLDEPRPTLEGKTPRQLLDIEQFDEVMMELGRIEHGIF